MPQLELTLRPRCSPPLEVAAWLLPGSDARGWLDEIADWRGDQNAIRLVVIRSTDNQSIAGALAIPAAEGAVASGRCLPYGCVGGRVYLPVDAAWQPAIGDAEIEELFDAPYLYVASQAHGLTAAEPAEILSPADLLHIEPEPGADWGRAENGLAFATRLTSILPIESWSADDILEQGRGDIGQHADQRDRLPKSPREPRAGAMGSLSRAAQKGIAWSLLGVAGLGQALRRRLPRGKSGRSATAGSGAARTGGQSASRPGWFESLGNYATRVLENVSRALQERRHQEIGRLLHLLEADPDQGLQFAIPLGGGDQHRGLANPAGQLGKRSTDFNLSKLGGGRPADSWDIPTRYQEQLVATYRELAGREIRLGRHRRAAYVYAQLLGDLRSAASALEHGRHFREAATLYRDRLHEARSAARCLENGGLWQEAVDAYRELGQLEKVGDLLRALDQVEQANDAYRQAAAEALKKDDRLEAARLSEAKLGDPARALEILDKAWPSSKQSNRCIQAAFAMRGRLGLHQEAIDTAIRLRDRAARLGRDQEAAEQLSAAFESYPEKSVRDSLSGIVRRLVAELLWQAPPSEARSFVNALGRVVPGDRLLLRDGHRYLDQLQAEQPALPPVFDSLQPRQQIDLGLAGAWRSAVLVDNTAYVGGVMEGRVVFARCGPKQAVERSLLRWPRVPVPTDAPLVVLKGGSHLQVFVIGQDPLRSTVLFNQSDHSQDSITAGTPEGHGVTWGAAPGTVGQTWSVERRSDPILVCVDPRGIVIATHSLLGADGSRWDDVAIPVPLHATSKQVLLGVGRDLLRVARGRIEVIEASFPSRIVGLTGGSPYAAAVVGISMESAAMILRIGSASGGILIAEELNAPKLLMNPGGFVIAADEHQIQLRKMSQDKRGEDRVELLSSQYHSLGRPVALLGTDQTDCFVMVTEKGNVCYYEVLG